MTLAVSLAQISLDDPNWTLLRNIGIGLVVVLWLAVRVISSEPGKFL